MPSSAPRPGTLNSWRITGRARVPTNSNPPNAVNRVMKTAPMGTITATEATNVSNIRPPVLSASTTSGPIRKKIMTAKMPPRMRNARNAGPVLK